VFRILILWLKLCLWSYSHKSPAVATGLNFGPALVHKAEFAFSNTSHHV